ncbi:MAG TPA: four helix bundle protein [Gemmatimonadaceae bacterium]
MSSSSVRSYRDLDVWQKGMQVRREVRAILQSISRQDRFEIGGQVARAALSIPCNVAEGRQRTGRKDYAQFLSFSRGSVGELDTQLRTIAEDYPNLAARIEAILNLLDEISRMLYTMIRKV